MTDQSGDVWSRATAEDEPRGVDRHLREAGRLLLAAALEVAAAIEEAVDEALGKAAGEGRRDRDAEASGGFWAGTSDRSGPSRPEGSGRPQRGDAWSSATAGDPTDTRHSGTRPCRDA
ncbi:hypothetical protein [Actinomadura terrae]|uniref:hypothetical protein n=1 Tax=Actinomadura terrae TaxID=604353 RepID=UPI001FA7AF9C|nr:hypothetical protein [Actinomadura terrae]